MPCATSAPASTGIREYGRYHPGGVMTGSSGWQRGAGFRRGQVQVSGSASTFRLSAKPLISRAACGGAALDHIIAPSWPDGGLLVAVSSRSPAAGPPAAPRAGVAASGPDLLLATKLHVPRIHPGFVPRLRLVEALSAGLARGRVLVCAPAGFGKTTLLADWARGGGRPVAWLSLDAADNDPARFWRHVVAALDRARPGLAERMGPLLGPPPPRSFEGLVTALINELAAQPGADEVVLVLDDYHQVSSEPVHAWVAFLLEHLPPGLHLVLASRADPPLPLARLRGRGQLAELRSAELRFTDREAAALLDETAGPGLSGTAVAALVARTEGWAAGLQLAGLSLRGQADPAGGRAAADRRREAEPADRQGARDHPRHGEETRQPPSGQARCRQPYRGGDPRPPARPHPRPATTQARGAL